MADDKKKPGNKDGGDEGGEKKAKPQLDDAQQAEIARKRAERAAKKSGKGGGGAGAEAAPMHGGGATGEKPGPARLRVLFDKEIGPQLMKELGLTNKMELPRLKKITVNMG